MKPQKQIEKPKKTAEVSVDKIVVNISGREQTLTLDEARKLSDALNALFGAPKTVFVPYVQPNIQYYIQYYTPIPPAVPYYVGDPLPFWPSTTCTTSGGTFFVNGTISNASKI